MKVIVCCYLCIVYAKRPLDKSMNFAAWSRLHDRFELEHIKRGNLFEIFTSASPTQTTLKLHLP